MKLTKNIIVFYHENCTDGFASAYIAWKKFKNKAEYVALSYNATGKEILKDKKIKISDLKDKEIYFIDFCLNETEIKKVQKVAKKLVVIDHHIEKKELVESLSGSVFRDGVSGAYLAHEYFFPKKQIPKLIRYISIGDTYTWGQEKYEKEAISYIHTLNYDFKIFAKAEKDFENKNIFKNIIETGKILISNFSRIIDYKMNEAKLIDFEGHKVYAINFNFPLKSELGHKLAEKTKSFALVYYFDGETLKVSLRGVGKVDLSKLAKKYSGGGHFNAASFRTKDEKFIMEFIKKIIS